MIKVMMHGCNGAMGQVISGIIEESESAVMAAGIDFKDDGHNPYPVFKNLEDCNVDVDVIIDFSSSKATDRLLSYVAEKQIPLVLCTTGLSEEQLKKVEETSKKTAILRSANMSLGVNVLLKLVNTAAKVLADADFDIDIVEKHHKLKVDAPSGTALALADAVNEALHNEYEYVYDRSQRRIRRPKKEIGISAVRGGTIVGQHDVIFAGQDEVIEFHHTAYSLSLIHI